MVAQARRRFEGQVAIVTGGSAGIGRATCLALAAEGAKVAVIARSQKGLDEARGDIQQRAGANADRIMTRALDVRSDADMASMAEETFDRWGRIDILVNSAGLLRRDGAGLRRLDQTAVEEWDHVLDVNLKGTFLSNRAVLPQMLRQRGGDIVNLSSMSGRRGLAFDAPYCASKFGVIGLSEAIAEEVRPLGVRVQVLLPGTFRTEVWRQAGPVPGPGNLPPVERIARVIVHLLTMPRDMYLVSPMMVPLDSLAETGWRGPRGTSTVDAVATRVKR